MEGERLPTAPPIHDLPFVCYDIQFVCFKERWEFSFKHMMFIALSLGVRTKQMLSVS